MTPQSVRGAQFKTIRKGLDPDEVRVFLEQVASELERAQNHATAMEARARAAVHRLQEVTEAQGEQPAVTPAATDSEPTSAQAEAITKTLLLAQRTADTTVADARAEADRLLAEARSEAEASMASSQASAAQLLEEARVEARSVGEEERRTLESDVSELMARRDFLESDVDHLEKFLDAQRDRLRETASSLVEMAERVPGGLGEVHRPVLSAAATGTDIADDTDITDTAITGDDIDDDPGELDDDVDGAVADPNGDDGDDTGEFEPDFSVGATDASHSDAPDVVPDDPGESTAPDRPGPAADPAAETPAEGFTLRFDDQS